MPKEIGWHLRAYPEFRLLLVNTPYMFLMLLLFMGWSNDISAQPITVRNGVEFDTPIRERIPLSVGYFIAPELDGHIHTSNYPRCGVPVRINNRDGHERLVANVLGSMFEGSSKVASLDNTLPVPYDLMVVVSSGSSDDSWFQAGLPCSTNLNRYEVWFKYQIMLFNSAGAKVEEFEQAAYGEAEASGNLRRIRSDSLIAATESAFLEMRNRLMLQFDDVLEAQGLNLVSTQEPSVPAEITTSDTLNAPAEIAPSLEGSGLVEDLIKLQALFDQGILNEEEFSAAKRRLLGL
jgi:hypothetical protein